MRFLHQRIFWVCNTDMGHDGYYYHYWENWVTNDYETVFAGYNKRSLNSKDTTWKTVKSRLQEI